MQKNPFQDRKPNFSHLYIFGSGGFGREVAWLAEQAWGKHVGLCHVVDDPRYLTSQVNGIGVLLLSDLVPSDDARFVVAIGDSTQRQRIASMLTAAGHHPATLVHPRVEMSPSVSVGAGTVICANSVVTCNVSIGVHVQVNLNCSVGHDAALGDYCTLSPGVNVSGNVHIKCGVFVGTNACFINGKPDKPLVIGEGAVIAAGACVINDVPPRVLVAGVPACIKKRG